MPLVSRNGYTFPHWPSLGRWLAENLGAESAILKGELVCLDEQGRSQFHDLYFRRKEPVYYAFDLLWLNGEDLRELPLLERKARLKELMPEQPSPILYADHVEETGVELFRKVCEVDLEGIVAKRKNAPYGKKTLWIKVRNPSCTMKLRPVSVHESQPLGFGSAPYARPEELEKVPSRVRLRSEVRSPSWGLRFPARGGRSGRRGGSSGPIATR